MKQMRNKSVLVLSVLLALTVATGMSGARMRQSTHGRYVVAPPLEQAQKIYVSSAAQPSANQPVAWLHYTEDEPASIHPVLRWSRVDGAVMYDVQVLERHEPDTAGQEAYYEPIVDTQRAYTNGIELALPDMFTGDVFYYRVCGLDLDGNPVSDYSDLERVPIARMGYFVEKPTPLSAYNEGNGTVLLYPVYDWLAVPGAASYELEILDGPPENPNGISPSEHRIDVYHPQYAQQYDQKARYGPHPFYWRVRALDSAGNPVGVYSDAQPFVTNPDADYEVATYGDSISHGGGSVSYSPTDWDFSYQHYLDFPSVNLAESGNTSTMTRERFEKDVLPFHPRYLIILMGSNSLRNGEGASIVMKDMEAVRQKCLENGIRPVFLTVPPVNPANIKKSFDSETADDWQFQFGRVNAYVRSHVHIDITPGMYDEKGELRTELALDGLHLDPAGKQLMAAAINEAWPEITSLPDSAWEE